MPLLLASLAAHSAPIMMRGKTVVEVDDKQNKYLKAISHLSHPYYDARRVLNFGKRTKKSDKPDLADGNKNRDAETNSVSKLSPFYSCHKILRNQRWK